VPERPLLNQAFYYRRSQIVAPQKTGKGPWSACVTCVEAVGPSLFGGWAVAGDVYDCAEHGCSCGWTWEYEPGEPKGIRHPSPLIQLTATSEDQVDNIYRPLTAMIRMGPLSEMMKVREGFIRIIGGADDPTWTGSTLSRLRRTRGSVTRSVSRSKTSPGSTRTPTRCGRSLRRNVAAPPAWAVGRSRPRTRGIRRNARRADDVGVRSPRRVPVPPAAATLAVLPEQGRTAPDPPVRVRGLMVGRPGQHRGRSCGADGARLGAG
jgi:hypothetical protein